MGHLYRVSSHAVRFHAEQAISIRKVAALPFSLSPSLSPRLVCVPPPYFVELTLSECQMNIRHDLGDVNCGRTMAMHGGVGLLGHKRSRERERKRERQETETERLIKRPPRTREGITKPLWWSSKLKKTLELN